jgi:hypothetical protein
MINRIWHGWTTAANADAYQRLLESEIAPGIAGRGIAGVRGPRLLRRRSADGEVEFVTIMSFPDWVAVEEFAGPGGRTAVVPPAARALLKRFDQESAHYEVVVPANT